MNFNKRGDSNQVQLGWKFVEKLTSGGAVYLVPKSTAHANSGYFEGGG